MEKSKLHKISITGTNLTEEMLIEAENNLIKAALDTIKARLKLPGQLLNNPQLVKDYLILSLAELEHEIFGVIFLDINLQFIADELLFRGTLAHCSIYPREILKAALQHNAASVILYHNHPTGSLHPSPMDIILTNELKKILTMVDIKLKDHLICVGNETYSFQEMGEI